MPISNPRFSLLLGAFLVAAALAAPSSAMAEQLPVEVNDHTGEQCPPVEINQGKVEGGCELQADSSIVTFTDGKSVLLNCSVSMDLNVEEVGWGYTSNMVVSPGQSQCGWSPRPCTSGGKSELQEAEIAHSLEEGIYMNTDICFEDYLGYRYWGTVKMTLYPEVGKSMLGTTPYVILPNTTVPSGWKLGMYEENWNFEGEDLELNPLY